MQAAGRDALVILLGCLPWFVPLGFVEGFLSPSPVVSPGLKAGLGICLLGLFLTTAWNPLMSKEER